MPAQRSLRPRWGECVCLCLFLLSSHDGGESQYLPITLPWSCLTLKNCSIRPFFSSFSLVFKRGVLPLLLSVWEKPQGNSGATWLQLIQNRYRTRA